MTTGQPSLSILGTRGIPARHSGFETFAQRLALHLAARGWNVTVYCQEESADGATRTRESAWRGVRLVTISVRGRGPFSTIVFDLHSAWQALRDPGVLLTLGYNTAVFGILFKLRQRRHVINMDGIEWQRAKWSAPVKLWFWLNERLACRLGDALVADHPEIRVHLASRVDPRRIAMIPYGADEVRHADPALLARYGLEPGRYALLIARPEPENSVLQMVRAFSLRKRGLRLAVLGRYEPERLAYHRRVQEAAGSEAVFLGGVYEQAAVDALRLHARFYLHGHRVGGTNPALVEALGAGCAVLAQDNRFNRWVAGTGARFFIDEVECARQIDELSVNDQLIRDMRAASTERFHQAFHWPPILERYEALLERAPAALRQGELPLGGPA